YIYIIVAAMLAVTAVNIPANQAEAKKKSKTTQTAKASKPKSSSKKSKASKSSKTNKASKSKSAKAGSSKNSRNSSGRGSKKNRNTGSSKGKTTKANSKASARISKRTAAPEQPKETPQNDSLTLAVNNAVLKWVPSEHNPGGLRVNSVKTDSRSRTATVSLNENFTYMPVTRPFIESMSEQVKKALPDSISHYRVCLNVANKAYSAYINKIDVLPEKYRKNPAFVTEANPSANPSKGMPNDIVALWPSHGRYYKIDSRGGNWAWQRGFLFQTLEDVYTMGYIYPYVVPMLENAGAYVFLPRERDTNTHEVIVDNDINEGGQIYSQPYYKETNGTHQWATGEFDGFIYDLPDFRDTENPFENGTYREVNTTRTGKPSVAGWYADIPKDGEYAIYVSYKTLPNSTKDARYTVNYSGGTKEFIVNQTMGGGTWIYLGTFPLEKGYSDTEPVVTLSNVSSSDGAIVTADAIKIGGGMGNIARSDRRSDIYYDPSTPEDDIPEDEEEIDEETEESDESDIDAIDNESSAAAKTQKLAEAPQLKRGTAPKFSTSGMPRWVEGARYWLQWAGFPESVYSPFHGKDDYKDDYTDRGHWVNYLAGGSRVLPDEPGLNLPVDLSFALHSDAGVRKDDSFVGTLGIYYTNGGRSYDDGTPRMNSRILTDMVMRQITNDIRQQYEPKWTRRSMWDKSYLEARVPEVPATLIELMSHQNFADMMYGLDPNFRFSVGRSIYKGLARFLAERKGREVVIQPLPVKDFAIKKTGHNSYRLSWEPTPDPLEKTAMPDKYVIMERNEGDLGFHKIAETSSTHYDVKVTDKDIHSFKIIAANAGGLSFPSEVLALCEGENDSKPVLIVNGFTRISGPAQVRDSRSAGFKAEEDFGVPYIKDISFTGYQQEFSRNAGERHGRSGSNYATKVIAGNTFDYVATHGDAIAENGYGFVSSSVGAVEKGTVKLTDYANVDLILGKQKTTVVGNGKSGINYRAFPHELQKAVKSFLDKGGNLIVSGQYAISDLFDTRSNRGDSEFAEKVLGFITLAEKERQQRIQAEAEEARLRRELQEKIARGEIEADSDSIPSSHISGATARTSLTSVRKPDGRLLTVAGKTINYSNTLNEDLYIVENPDILVPMNPEQAKKVLTFSANNLGAGYSVKSGKGTLTLLSVPIESMYDQADRDRLFKDFLK
ncbi:MAG: hypothetical protein K2K81_02820, partial [Muribaculaceae bacterium]|nr:hypothetical protein [Muribaculaceae bacterium]